MDAIKLENKNFYKLIIIFLVLNFALTVLS